MRYRIRSLCILSLLVALVGACRSASADERVTLNVATRGPSGSSERIVRVFLQGDQARVEDGSATVRIYDAKSGRVYRLDTASKTYRVDTREPRSMADRLAQPDRTKSSMKATAGSDTRTIIGISASRTTVAAHVEADPSSPTTGGGFSQDGMRTPSQTQRPAFGIPVAVGSGADADPTENDAVVAIHLEGEYWLADDSAVARNPLALRRVFEESLPHEKLAFRLLDGLVKAVNGETPRLPLTSRVSLRLTRASTSIDAAESDRPEIVVTTTVTDRVEGPLDRMLFIVPADFHAADS